MQIARGRSPSGVECCFDCHSSVLYLIEESIVQWLVETDPLAASSMVESEN